MPFLGGSTNIHKCRPGAAFCSGALLSIRIEASSSLTFKLPAALLTTQASLQIELYTLPISGPLLAFYQPPTIPSFEQIKYKILLLATFLYEE